MRMILNYKNTHTVFEEDDDKSVLVKIFLAAEGMGFSGG
jgi:hypothetical protein